MIIPILQIVSVGIVLAYVGCMVIMIAWAGVLTYCDDWSTSPGVHIYMLEQDDRIRRDLYTSDPFSHHDNPIRVDYDTHSEDGTYGRTVGQYECDKNRDEIIPKDTKQTILYLSTATDKSSSLSPLYTACSVIQYLYRRVRLRSDEHAFERALVMIIR